MDTSIQPLDNIDQYVKRLNWYLQEHYPANKKITSEEWNALFLALIRQGNLQEETLEKICNNYLPLQIAKVNVLVDTANNHEGRIQVLRTDTDKALQDSKYAIDTSEEALRRVMENIGTAVYVDSNLARELFYSSDPQEQLNSLVDTINTFEKDFGDNISDVIKLVEDEVAARKQAITAETVARLAQIKPIKDLIPSQATTTNQLADKAFVNSSINTATATFKGTYTTLEELKAVTANKNDYAFYDHTDTLGNRIFDKYKYDAAQWLYEYSLNNSSFTDAQWKAINSGATTELINKILTNENKIPTQFIKEATVSNDILTLTKNDGSSFTFEGGGGYIIRRYD